MNKFNVYDFKTEYAGELQNSEANIDFIKLCDQVKKELDQLEQAEKDGNATTVLERQKEAILGEPSAIAYYKSQIRDIIINLGKGGMSYPKWYVSLTDAVYNEILGFAGLVEWIEGRTPELQESSSAKVIGDRIYFLINGELELQPQTMSVARRKQFRKALLLATPEKNDLDFYHEVVLKNEQRVTIYNEGLAKKGQDSIVLRKGCVKIYTFEEQANRHTIPQEAVPLFREMVKIGYNVAMIGPVRSAKTTFLTTWQSQENPKLEGVQIEDTAEIPLHIIMPKAPIMQFVPNREDFPLMIKRIMRSDADYIIMAEARDGVELNTAVQAANKGTRRVKITFHTSDALDFCYDVADEIVKTFGGDLRSSIAKVAKSFHYLFQFVQLSDKSQKRLKAIWEVRYDLQERRVIMQNICKYRFETDDWEWSYGIGEDKKAIAYEEDIEAFKKFDALLKELARVYPYDGNPIYIPSYDYYLRKGRGEE